MKEWNLSVRAAIWSYLLLALCEAAPVAELASAASYLTRYGYLKQSTSEGSAALTSQETVVTALREFQAFAGLNVTGELDSPTLKLMATPRCGVQDMDMNLSDSNDTHVRTKRYDIHGSRWRIRNITYHVSKYPRRLTREQVDGEIQRALQVWANHTDLVFTRWPGGGAKIHIDIRFEKGDHGDWDVFDGNGGTLAHAYFPLYGGDVHFDDDEDWRVGADNEGTSLFQIAVHELGHSLGLHHSELNHAVMGPYYKNYSATFRLHQDDIDGITYLYGAAPSSTSAPRRPTSATGSGRKLCVDPVMDTIFTDKRGEVYVFKGDVYYKLRAKDAGYANPRLISDTWAELPGNIDAAFTYHTGKTYFFKEQHYWRYVGTAMDGDYPKKISDAFFGVPDDLDAAFQWGGNGNIYFFKGAQFWMYDPQRRPPVSRRYPKAISNWDGVPDDLDGALLYRGYSYFFKGNSYYRFDDHNFTVDQVEPPFPRTTSHWWYGCKKRSSKQLVTD